MFTNDEAGNDALTDTSLEEMLLDTTLEGDDDDDAFDDDNDVVLQADLINAELVQDVEIPAEVSEYIITLESQTQKLEKELAECDELLMYLPHQTKGNRQAVVLYEDSRQLDEAAAEHGMSVEELKQKILCDLDQEQFTEEDVKREFEEFSRLQEELNEIRSAIRLGENDEVKAILPRENTTLEWADNSYTPEKTTLALCNGDAVIDADSSPAITGYTGTSCTAEHVKVGPLVSSTALSGMRDYVLEQLRTTEQHHEVKVRTLTKSIEKCKQEEEASLLYQDERKKMLQQVHNKEEAAMLERLKENERLGEEEQKVKNEQTTQELNLIQAEIDHLSEALEKDKQFYEVSHREWIEHLDTARQKAAIQIQKVYRGYRARRKNSSVIEELKGWKELNKEEKYKRRIMEVEYEIRYREEQVQMEKERQEMEEAEKKMKEEEEERRKENEHRRKEEEDRIVEELRKETERKNEEQRIAEERQHKEEVELRKQAELKSKEEERLRKEEEKQRKNDEKKKQKEEEKRKKEETRRIKEEEKRRKNEEKQIKEEKIKTKEEGKNMSKEEERIEKGKDEEIKEEEVKINLKEEVNMKVEKIRKEKKEVKETNERSEEGMLGNNEMATDKERKRNGFEENTKDKHTIVNQAKEKGITDIKEEIKKEESSETTKMESETSKTKFDTQNLSVRDNLSSNNGIADLLHQAEKSSLSSKDIKPDISCTDGKPDISHKDEKVAISSASGSTGSQLLSPPSVSMKTDLSPLHSHAGTNTKSKSILVQQSSASVTSSASFQEATGANLRMPSTESQVIYQKRLNWMKSCIPWSKISCEPWKLKQTSQKSYKRPTRTKRLPPVSEAVILEKAHAASLREVTSVTLTSLPECSLSTLGQCWSLQYLTVTRCGLVCLEGLGQCKHLLYINAENNNIEYMDLKDLGSLQVVRLAHNGLSVIHGLDGCINLRSLDLSHNRITRISGLGSLRRIHTLNLSHNQLVSSDGLEEALTLQHLDLSHNFLQHVSNISKLCLLSDLTVACNNLLQVPELQNQVLLQTLCLQENSIKSLEPVGQYWLPLLHTLNCSQNLFESLTGISSLILLSHLDVSHNQITDMENLLPGITQNKRLETLMLEGNPLVDAYAQEYKQLTVRAVPSLKSLNHLSVQIQAAESDVDAGANLCDDFIQMCLSQVSQHTALNDEFHSQMKVLLVNQHVTGETLCSTCFTFCDTSFKMASEHRFAHEYGDTSATNDINHTSVFIMNEKAKFNSITDFTQQPETMVDRKHIFNVSGSYNTANMSASDKDSVRNVCGNMVNSAAVLDKENYLPVNLSIVHKSSYSVPLKSHISNVTKNHHSDLTQANMQPDCHVSNNANSTTRQSQNYRNSSLDATEMVTNTSQSTEAEFSLSERSNSNRNNSHSNTSYQPSDPGFSTEGMNRLALAGETNLANSVQDNNFTVKAKPLSFNLNNHDNFGQYLSGKDKFEIALQTQSPTFKAMTDVQTQNNASIYQSTNGSAHKLLSGVKANIVGEQLLQQDASGISKDLELSAHDLDGNVDSMEFDIDTFLDMGELDELLELGWRPADVSHIPQSMHPILGQINAADNHSVNNGKQKITSQGHMLPHPPNQPSHAWTNSPVSSEFKFSGQTLAHGAASPITAPSPLSVASNAETVSRGSVRSKKEELSEEWGFKDSRTVEMMLARAKKMKYNSERRRKLDKLDPQQKLHLLKKLEEKYRIKTTRSPSAKILPRKEYFKAREEELHRQELEKQTEGSTRFNRMFEWLHTQVGDYNISSSRLNPGLSLGYSSQDNRSNLIGRTLARKSSPLSDHNKPAGKDVQQVRRYSSGETQSGHSTILPPIHESSLPSGNKKDRISFRDTPVESSGGWGGGKKRGKIKS